MQKDVGRSPGYGNNSHKVGRYGRSLIERGVVMLGPPWGLLLKLFGQISVLRLGELISACNVQKV